MRNSSETSVVTKQARPYRNRLLQLIVAVFILYFLYFLTGLLYENIINNRYRNILTHKNEKVTNPDALNFTLFLVAWIFGEIYMKQFKVKKVGIPQKNGALAGFTYSVGQSCSILAIRRLGYPLVMMAQSASVIVVIIIAIFFTRVKDRSQILEPKKLVLGFIVTTGIIFFYMSAPNITTGNHKWFQGMIFIVFVLLSEGLLPDLQAQIKSKYKPQPVQMMAEVNRWATYVMFLYLLFSFKLWKFIFFIVFHPGFAAQLLGHAIIAAIGQLYVYKVIKQFKQHILPFVRASRKVLTVGVSIVFYGHETNLMQVTGICLVLSTIFYEFYLSISEDGGVFSDDYDVTYEQTIKIQSEEGQSIIATQEKIE